MKLPMLLSLWTTHLAEHWLLAVICTSSLVWQVGRTCYIISEGASWCLLVRGCRQVESLCLRQVLGAASVGFGSLFVTYGLYAYVNCLTREAWVMSRCPCQESKVTSATLAWFKHYFGMIHARNQKSHLLLWHDSNITLAWFMPGIKSHICYFGMIQTLLSRVWLDWQTEPVIGCRPTGDKVTVTVSLSGHMSVTCQSDQRCTLGCFHGSYTSTGGQPTIVPSS